MQANPTSDECMTGIEELTPSWLILLSVMPSISSVRLCSSIGKMTAINSSRSSPRTADVVTFIFRAVCEEEETNINTRVQLLNYRSGRIPFSSIL